jgi:membrane protein DedA with SNARE-associated domain
MTSLVAGAVGASTSPDGTELTGVAGWAVDLMERLGGPGAGLAIALENLFPPLPSEIILPLAGFTASQGDFTLAEALLWTTLGSLVGAVTLYWLGALFGRRRMRALAVRMPLVKVEDIDRAEDWFARHGHAAVFFGRMVPIFRSFISIPAGIERMPFGTFVLLTTAGSAIWNTVFVLAGYLLGEQWYRVEPYAGTFQTAVIAAVVLGVGYFVVSRLVRARRAPTD